MTEKTDRTGKGFRKLIVWQRAHQLSLLVYKLTEKFPKSESARKATFRLKNLK